MSLHWLHIRNRQFEIELFSLFHNMSSNVLGRVCQFLICLQETMLYVDIEVKKAVIESLAFSDVFVNTDGSRK